MKPWMKTCVTLLIGFLVGIAATAITLRFCAHPPHHPPGMADEDRILKHLTSKLGLTDDQKTKVKALLDTTLPKTDALHNEEDLKLHELRDSFNSQLRPLLTPDQQLKFDLMVAKWEKREKDQNGAPPSGTPPPTGAVSGK